MTSIRSSARPVLGTLGVLGAAAAVWGVGIERHLYTVRQVSLPVLPVGSAPLRILHISDIHMAPWQRRKQRWVASLAALEPDLVINTGDNLGHTSGLEGVRAALHGLRGVPGVFVHGSNDLYAPQPRNPLRYFLGPSSRIPDVTRIDTVALDRYLTDELGWAALNDAAARVDAGGRTIDAFGVNDAHHGLDRLDRVSELTAELRALPGSPELTIGVTHAPYRRVLDSFTAAGADALFAGHTHGGQVRVPGVGALVANCDLPLSQTRGLSEWAAAGRRVPLHVSAGIGHSIYAPVRFACRPETTLLTLVARPSA